VGYSFPTVELTAVISIHELIIVYAIRCVALDALNSRLAGVEGNDVVDQALTGWREVEGLGGIGREVFRGGGLARLEVFAGRGSGAVGEVDG